MKQLAIMKDVGIGMRDCHTPVLWFSAHTSECAASLQVLSWDEGKKLIIESGVHDAHDLEGKACWIENEGSLLRFAGFAKI